MKKLRTNAARQSTRNSDAPSGSCERYFTDGSNLSRFVEWLTPAGDAELATLEDSRTLRLLLVSGDYLTKASLRPVA
jgi:hypothetical protein